MIIFRGETTQVHSWWKEDGLPRQLNTPVLKEEEVWVMAIPFVFLQSLLLNKQHWWQHPAGYRHLELGVLVKGWLQIITGMLLWSLSDEPTPTESILLYQETSSNPLEGEWDAGAAFSLKGHNPELMYILTFVWAFEFVSVTVDNKRIELIVKMISFTSRRYPTYNPHVIVIISTLYFSFSIKSLLLFTSVSHREMFLFSGRVSGHHSFISSTKKTLWDFTFPRGPRRLHQEQDMWVWAERTRLSARCDEWNTRWERTKWAPRCWRAVRS